jgi:hypothetical protein
MNSRKISSRAENDLTDKSYARGGPIEEKDSKKQIPLRLSASLWRDLVAWAEDDFRSLNGQIEYLLSECVKKRKLTHYSHEGESHVRNTDGNH